MKKDRNLLTSFTVFLLIFAIFNTFVVIPNVNSAIDVDMSVENVFWGTPPNNVQVVTPGSTNVPLTVIIHNNSNNTLRGVVGYLDLIYPFTDFVTESNRSKAEGQPLQQGDVFNQTGDILPSGSFSLTFNLNIDEDAVKGRYKLNLTVTYSVKNGSFFYSGVPKVFEVEVVLNNQPPVIYSTNPPQGVVNVYAGESVNFTVVADDPDNDTITIEWVFDGDTVGSGPNYTLYADPNKIGSHTLVAEVSDGNLTTTATWNVNINRRINTDVQASTKYIYAGKKTSINVNITNNVWVGTVTIGVAVPQGVALLSDASYTFENVVENETLLITVVVYVPEASIGQSIPLTLSINYRDENGNNYNENQVVSLVVRGVIDIRIYDIQVSPLPAKSGDLITVTGTILNAGNVLARFTNITILNTSIITPELGGYVYIGDVEANSPTPFTIRGYVNPNLKNGTYMLYFNLTYTDDLFEEHWLIFSVTLVVVNSVNASQNTGGSETPSLPLDIIYVSTTIVALAAVAILYLRRRGE